jgi:hypothetical protein
MNSVSRMSPGWIANGFGISATRVIDNFDIVGVAIAPDEADTILIVHSNTVLSLAIFLQGLKTIAGRYSQALQYERGVENSKLLPRGDAKICGDTPALACLP